MKSNTTKSGGPPTKRPKKPDAHFLADYVKGLKPGKFQQGALVRPEFGVVDVFLEDVPFFAEWLKGERADISILRAVDDNRVVGAHLPLRNFNGKFRVVILPVGPAH